MNLTMVLVGNQWETSVNGKVVGKFADLNDAVAHLKRIAEMHEFCAELMHEACDPEDIHVPIHVYNAAAQHYVDTELKDRDHTTHEHQFNHQHPQREQLDAQLKD